MADKGEESVRMTAADLEKDQLERRVHDLTIDSVTQLLKKEGFIDKVKHNDEETNDLLTESFALLFLDLHDLKKVNEHSGHGTGDFYLSEVSEIIDRVTWGEKDRVGLAFRGKEGDEFIAILEVEDNKLETYKRRVTKFKKELEKGLEEIKDKLSEKEISDPGVSIGTFFVKEGLTGGPEEKLEKFFSNVDKEADQSLLESKRNKSGNLVDMQIYEDLSE